MKIHLFHTWKTLQATVTEVYESSRDTMPFKRFTRILYVCTECGKHKTKKLTGAFTI